MGGKETKIRKSQEENEIVIWYKSLKRMNMEDREEWEAGKVGGVGTGPEVAEEHLSI